MNVNPAYAKEHMAFLGVRDGKLHFGCRNPFCGHGNPALPNHWAIPCETDDMTVDLVSNKSGKVTFKITPKRSAGKLQAGVPVTITADANMESCRAEFERAFNSN